MSDQANNPLDPAGNAGVVQLDAEDLGVADGFGQGPFGERDWVHETMWATLVTSLMREEDVARGGQELRRWQYGIGRTLDRYRRKARDQWTCWSAWEAQARSSGVDVDVVAKEAAAATGETTLTIDGGLLDEEDDRLRRVQSGWEFVGSDGKRFDVLRVRRNYPRDTTKGGTIYGWLHEIDVKSVASDVAIAAGTRFEPPNVLRRLAAHYGISFVEGLVEAHQRDLVARQEQVRRRKGSTSGYDWWGRARGFQLVASRLYGIGPGWVSKIGAGNKMTGHVPWHGFVVALGDGTGTAVDSEETKDTLLGVTDTDPTRIYLRGRRLGEGLEVNGSARQPSSNGAYGDVMVRYSVLSADGTIRAFAARDKRDDVLTGSSSIGALVPASVAYVTALPSVTLGRVKYGGYARSPIVIEAVDQSVKTGKALRPFAKGTRISIDFVDARTYTDLPPEVARFDDVKADVLGVDRYRWENPALYQWAVTVVSTTPAVQPWTATSEHVVRVRFTGGFSPIPAPTPNVRPTGDWKLSDGTDEWWVEKVTSVDADEDDLVVVGAVPPTAGIVTVTLVPSEVPDPTYAPSRCVKLVSTPISGAYSSPSPGSSDEADMLFGMVAEATPAHVVVAITEKA